MACDRNDGDHGSSFLALDFVGAVVPEDAVSAGSLVLSVRLEDLLAIYARQRSEFVRMKAWMVRVYFEVSKSLANLRQKRCMRRRLFQRRQLRVCRRRELELAPHGYLRAYRANEPRLTLLPSADSRRPCFTLASASAFS